MKFEKKHIFILLFCTILLILLIFSLIFLVEKNKSPVIAFYGLEEKIVKALESSFEKNSSNYFTKEKQKYSFLVLEEEDSLENHLKSNKDIAVVFSYGGANQNSVSENALVFDKSILSVMPTSMKLASNNSLPILLNHLEIDINNNAFSKIDSKKIVDLDYVLNLGKNEDFRKDYQVNMTIIGESDKNLSYFLSAFIESRFGVEELNKLNDFLTSNQIEINYENLFEYPETQCLKSICDELLNLKKEKLVHSEWEDMSFVDVQNYMETKQVAFTFMDLYSHREISYGIIKNYSETFFPSGRYKEYPKGRSLIVPTVMATCFETSNKSVSKECMKIVENMVSLKEQNILARDSGLAPVGSFADTQDKQAYNVRLWAASSDSLAMDLYSAFTDSSARKNFFKFLRNYL